MEKEIFSQNLINRGSYLFNSKKPIIFVTILAILVIGGYFGYKYWQKGTPDYSLNQLRVAFQNKDSTEIQKYIDIDSVFNNFWPRYKINAGKNDISPLLTTDSNKNYVQDLFRTSLYGISRGEEKSLIFEFLSQLFELKKWDININENMATLKIDYKASNKNINLSVVFSRQSDKTWKITDIQGYEDIVINNYFQQTRDKTRISYLSMIRTGIELYFDDNGEYPNSLDLLSPRYLTRIPLDPLDDTSYEYAYSVSDNKILHYHLGSNLELLKKDELDTDADCNSGINPTTNCPEKSIYINGFNGSDTQGCNEETNRACYDLTDFFQ